MSNLSNSDGKKNQTLPFEGNQAAWQLVKCMLAAFLVLGVVLLAIYSRSLLGEILSPVFHVLVSGMEVLFSMGALVVAFQPLGMMLLGFTILAGAGCYGWRSCEDSSAETQKVNAWAVRLGILGAVFMGLSFVGFLSSSVHPNYFKEDTLEGEVRARVSKEQALAIYQRVRTGVRAAYRAAIVSDILPDEWLLGMGLASRANLGTHVFRLYEGVNVGQTHYFNCKRTADSYLAAKPYVQERLTLIVNGKRVEPGQKSADLCRKLRFNGHQIGYSEALIFGANR